MSRSSALRLLAAAFLIVGVVLGLVGISAGDSDVDCGTAFSPVSQHAEAAAILTDGEEPEQCRDAVSSRRQLAYGAMGLAGVALIASFLAPAPRPAEPPVTWRQRQ